MLIGGMGPFQMTEVRLVLKECDGPRINRNGPQRGFVGLAIIHGRSVELVAMRETYDDYAIIGAALELTESPGCHDARIGVAGMRHNENAGFRR